MFGRIGTAMLVGGVMLACGDGFWAAGQEKKPVIVDEKANGKTVKIEMGQELQVRLAGERKMTGWGGLILDPGKGVVAVDRRSFEAAPKAADSAIGTYVYHLKLQQPGVCQIHCRYIYPDGNGYELMPRLATQVVREFKVKIEVVPAGK